MSGRQTLLAEIEARRRSAAKSDSEIDVVATDLTIASDEDGYNPYDKPGRAKPLAIDSTTTTRGKAIKPRRR